MKHIFLSASVPLPERNRVYFETADVFLIREAIRALIEVILPIGTITFGSHPAITPLVSLYLANSGYPRERITAFLSDFFPRSADRNTLNFADVRYTQPVRGERAASLTLMRQEMIRSRQFDAAVLVGGMEGIDEEVEIFRQYHPRALVLPVPSTGAAARIVYRSGNFPADLETEISFASMFRRHLLRPPKTINADQT
ncbi:SLOG domain-containing protein [Alcaligenes aquatilis]|jgi:hypothetical protein|uniref:SLOG domain-containing protein n=1 Tax=Alcaligenes aquatilis TaxID=323284 RepID=UPI003D1B354F